MHATFHSIGWLLKQTHMYTHLRPKLVSLRMRYCQWMVWCIQCVCVCVCVCVCISQFGAKFNPVYQRYAMNYERTSPYRHKLLSQPGYKKYQEVRVRCYDS